MKPFSTNETVLDLFRFIRDSHPCPIDCTIRYGLFPFLYPYSQSGLTSRKQKRQPAPRLSFLLYASVKMPCISPILQRVWKNKTFELQKYFKKTQQNTKKDGYTVTIFSSSARRDSNPRPSPWQGDTPPLSHSRISYFYFYFCFCSLERCI